MLSTRPGRVIVQSIHHVGRVHFSFLMRFIGQHARDPRILIRFVLRSAHVIHVFNDW